MNEVVTQGLNKIFSVLSIVAISISVLLIIIKLFVHEENVAKKLLTPFFHSNSILIAWSLSTLSTLGSLFYSEVSGFIPCDFCWYERIAMYPLVLILGVGLIKKYQKLWLYALPLSVSGLLISIYHYQLQIFPNQNSISCTSEASCSSVWIMEFGFITMPFMAVSTFLLISVILLFPQSLSKN